jgi:formate dehydrogenase subunit gamma
VPGLRDMHVVVRLLFVLCLTLWATGSFAADTGGAKEQAQRQQDQPLNNAPVWREVRKGESPYQTTQVRGVETNILVQSQGETWRQLRPLIAVAGGLILVAVLVGLLGYYWWRGAIGLHDKPVGRFIKRFSDIDRLAHWTMGISFVILAISGLIITFGKYVLLPVLGYTLFSWIAFIAKNLHNFVAPVFLLSVPLFIVLFIRDNLPRLYDIQWLLKFGGMLSKSGAHIPSGRFNAGEKALFWGLVCVFSVALCVSGVIMLFPNYEQGRSIMQISNITHVVCALLAIAMACFHMYLGTVGMKGALDAMRTGYVDETWAKEHHQIWYDEVKAGRANQHTVDEVPAKVHAQIEQTLRST